MAMYSFSLENFTAVACRSKEGRDDIWLILTVNCGKRGDLAIYPLGSGVQTGQEFTGPWSAGPYQASATETNVATYTFVNLGGSSTEDQDKIIVGLGTGIASAVTKAAGGAAASVEAAIRGMFGATGELLAAPALTPGDADCRGLVGVYVASFTATSTPAEEVVETTPLVTLAGTSPATCGTTPQSTAVFSVRRAPNLFSQSTPVTVLLSAPAGMELFAVGMDGLLRYAARTAGGSFGAWQVVGRQTFSQSAPMVALSATTPRREVFGTGTDGVIYRLHWTPASGWEDWTPVSAPGQFLPDTPVSAILQSGAMSLFAVDPDGVAQSTTWSGDALQLPWAPLPGMIFARRTPLLVMSHVDTWVEVFAVDPLGHDYHTSRGNTAPPWGPWQMLGASPLAMEPSSRRYCGLTFDVFTGPAVSAGLGMAWFRVDGGGNVNELGWTAAGWIARKVLPGMRSIFAGPVSGVRMGNQLLLYMVDGQTGRIGVVSWSMPVPFNGNAGWSGWTLLPAGPALAKERAITAVSTDDSHVELFVVDRDGLVQHMVLDTAPGWNDWSLV